MILSETGGTPVATPPLDAFRAHLRLASGFADEAPEDASAAGYLAAAVAAVERRLGGPLVVRRLAASLSRLDRDGRLRLPAGPVTAIAGAMMEGPAGTRALDTAGWTVEAEARRPRLSRAGGPLPAIPPGHRLRVEFDAGLAPDWDRVPADLAEAVLLLAATLYEERDLGAAWPPAAMALCAPHAPVRL
jgi:uncharacterized phiE125 gp8 family phage protein